MKKHFVAACLVASSPSTAIAQQTIERPQYNEFAPILIQLDGIPTSALVVMLLRDVMRVPYVISPEVLADRRATSVRLSIPRDKIPEGVVGYLRRAGFVVQLQGGSVYVGKNGRNVGSVNASQMQAPDGGFNIPSGSPVNPSHHAQGQSRPAGEPYQAEPSPALPVEPLPILAYMPAHRDVAYLASAVAPMFPDIVIGSRGDVKADTARSEIASTNGPDVLVISGKREDLDKARKLIETLDRPRPLVSVKAVVMQVANSKERGSALTVIANLANGNLQAGSFPGEAVGTQFLRLGAGAVSAVLSAVRQDNRFKVVASPNLSALSGAVATINSGSQVPTLGAVTFAEGGQSVQSVTYRDSGITLTVRPVVRGDLVELDVRQERSTFVRTTTGVEDSPTLNKSSVDAQLILKSGESVVLAGLSEQSQGARKDGIFGGLLGVRSFDQSESELVIVLQAEIVPAADVPPGVFVDIFDGDVKKRKKSTFRCDLDVCQDNPGKGQITS